MRLSVILVGFITFCYCSEARVQLRLADGKHEYEGRVEALVDGVWGPISARDWTKKAAQVVCRQLGFGGKVIRYTKGKTYGKPKNWKRVPVWLEFINCKGTEAHLDDCPHSGWVQRKKKLKNYDLAGVMCYSETGRVLVPPVSSSWGAINKTKIKFWLDGEMENGIISAGYLAMSYKNMKGYVCADGWDYHNMIVACGHLGFPHVRKFLPMQTTRPFILNDVNCAGPESSLLSCNHTGFGYNIQACRSNAAVWLQCKVFNRTARFKNIANLKLRGAPMPSAGRVELKYEHSWANLCDDTYNLFTANTICRSLGYGTASEASFAAKYGQGTQLTIVDEMKCSGLENDISECQWTVPKRSKCSHFEDAGVVCNVPEYLLQEVRLSGGNTSSEGRVEVKINGEWGTVCGDHWHIKAAMIVCRELGSNFAEMNITGDQFGLGGKMVMSKPICTGDEVSLTQCLYDDDFKCSSPHMVASVRCTDALPDLALSIRDIIKTIRVNYLPLNALRCAYEENCLASTAARYMPYINYYTRRLMRFSTVILNFGSADYRPLVKKEDWIWHSCHKHYHSQEEFAIYDILSSDQSKKIAEGHKASFCLEDTACLNGVDRTYNCTGGRQGISVNCYDDYAYSVDCQWIDVTDIDRFGRSYVLHVNINPRLEVPETDFDNNVVVCDIVDKGSFIRVRDCGYDYCTSGVRTHDGNANRACCIFPFKYRGVWYETCTKAGFHYYWCSTSENYDRDFRWGIC